MVRGFGNNMKYQNFDEMVAKARELGPMKVVVTFPDDPDVMRAMMDGMNQNLINPIFVGKVDRIKNVAAEIGLSLGRIDVIEQGDAQKAADLSLDMVSDGEAAFVVKGNIISSYLFRGLVRITKQRTPNQALCTVSFHELPSVDKLFIISDGGVNIFPDSECKAKIIANTVSIMHGLGCPRPKVMVLSAQDAAGSGPQAIHELGEIRQKARDGEIGECEICKAMNLYQLFPDHFVHSDEFPDILIVPNIDAGNIIVKSISHVALGDCQAITSGGGIFFLTPSRSDGYKSRLMNLSLGLVIAASSTEGGEQ